jgi:hypothetical protein
VFNQRVAKRAKEYHMDEHDDDLSPEVTEGEEMEIDAFVLDEGEDEGPDEGQGQGHVEDEAADNGDTI